MTRMGLSILLILSILFVIGSWLLSTKESIASGFTNLFV